MTTLRVVLGAYAISDAPALAEADLDAEHRRRFDFPPDFVPSLRHSQQVLARWEAERVAGTRLPYAIRDAETGELVGGCELLPMDAGIANVSYWTYPRHRRRGIAAEAVRQLCEMAFGPLGFRRLEIVVDPDNLSSRRVAIRNGFVQAGERDGRVLYLRASGE